MNKTTLAFAPILMLAAATNAQAGWTLPPFPGPVPTPTVEHKYNAWLKTKTGKNYFDGTSTNTTNAATDGSGKQYSHFEADYRVPLPLPEIDLTYNNLYNYIFGAWVYDAKGNLIADCRMKTDSVYKDKNGVPLFVSTVLDVEKVFDGSVYSNKGYCNVTPGSSTVKAGAPAVQESYRIEAYYLPENGIPKPILDLEGNYVKEY
ncbi:MAG TPA: hypothetical protein VNL74_07155 [Methylococcus sp.]|nr:hypothetical protein [Methylococcus sp.]